MCIYIYIYISWFELADSWMDLNDRLTEDHDMPGCYMFDVYQPRENMVGVNMVLAEYHQNTLK